MAGGFKNHLVDSTAQFGQQRDVQVVILQCQQLIVAGGWRRAGVAVSVPIQLGVGYIVDGGVNGAEMVGVRVGGDGDGGSVERGYKRDQGR